MHFELTCLCILASAFIGCGRAPRNPAAEIVNNSPEKVDDDDFEVFHIRFNHAELAEPLTVTAGDEVSIAGRVKLKPDRFPIGTTGMLHLRFQPVGTPEKDWDDLKSVMDWPRPIGESMEYAGTVTAPPGEYELRAYVILHGIYLDLPIHRLLAKGRLTVVPAESSSPRP